MYYILFSNFIFYFFKLLSEFDYIYSGTMITRTQFCSISTPNPQPEPPQPCSLSPLEIVSFSKPVGNFLPQ